MKVCTVFVDPTNLELNRGYRNDESIESMYEILRSWHLMASCRELDYCVITDDLTQIPSWWGGDVFRCTSKPPFERHIYNRTSWLKAHAFDFAGGCIVADDDLVFLKKPKFYHKVKYMAMKERLKTPQIIPWDSDGRPMLSAQVVVIKRRISDAFERLYLDCEKYYDEIGGVGYGQAILSTIHYKLGGSLLPTKQHIGYSVANKKNCNFRKQSTIHFSGTTKSEMSAFVKKMIHKKRKLSSNKKEHGYENLGNRARKNGDKKSM